MVSDRALPALLARTLGGAMPRRALVRLGLAAPVAVIIGSADPGKEAAAKRCPRGRKQCLGKCIKKSKPCAPVDRCGNVSVCGAPYVSCGTAAGTGAACSCERTVEGETACINFISACAGYQSCTSTDGPEATSCRNLAGFHFFCQKPKTNGAGQPCGCGQVCLPECDNPGG